MYSAASEIDYLQVDLPIHGALTDVNRPLMLLHRKDRLGAKAALDDALDHVEVFKSVMKTETDVMSETDR